MAKIIDKMVGKAAGKKSRRVLGKPESKATEETFESEMRTLKDKAMTDAGRQREALALAIKYNRPVTIGDKTYIAKQASPKTSAPKDAAEKTSKPAAKSSKTRTKLATIGKSVTGRAGTLVDKLVALDKITDKKSEKATLLRNAINDLVAGKNALPPSVVKKARAEAANRKPQAKARGGMAKKNKVQMMRGGMANKKEHMYAAGGSVIDNLTSGQKKMVMSMAKANKK